MNGHIPHRFGERLVTDVVDDLVVLAVVFPIPSVHQFLTGVRLVRPASHVILGELAVCQHPVAPQESFGVKSERRVGQCPAFVSEFIA
ncbi:hypothetical protein A5621_13040 [Mycobacterium colombiense]|nr:hypothetical protein A5621_13040 [Mycobacterium colombiense]